jgi:hypothetical protein
MVWDVPWKMLKPSEKGKKLIYLLQINLIAAGFITAELWYPESLPAPDFSQLNQTKGSLEKVVLKTIKGQMASIIEIRDEFGGLWVFPKGKRHLPIKNYMGGELGKKCIGEKTVVMWAKEPELFLFGGGIEVWAMETCDPQIKVSYQEMVDVRKSELKQNKQIFVVGLSVCVLTSLFFVVNFRKAEKLIKQKQTEIS